MALFNSTSWAKYSVIAASLAGVMMLGGCAKKEEHTTTTLNIGYQKYGILPILKARGDLEKSAQRSRRTSEMGRVSCGTSIT